MKQNAFTLRIRTQGFTAGELEQLEKLVESISGTGTVQPRTGQPTPNGGLFAAAPNISITVLLSAMAPDRTEDKVGAEAVLATNRKLAEEVAAKTYKWVDSRFAGGRREVELDVELCGSDQKLVKLKELKR